jgi:aryl-alcohol dehydrogenase-like predicted oxidoreductase
LRNLILGSAQFGMGYGIYIKCLPISKTKLREILSSAYSSGIDSLDSALNYQGVTSNLASQSLISKFRIGTKISYNSENELLILGELRENQNQLNIEIYESVLIHNWSILSRSEKVKGIDFLYKIRDLGFTKKIGLSVYETQELSALTRKIDIVQAPLNYFNLNFLNNSQVFDLKDSGTEFHARSIFHQGTLLHHSNLPQQFDKKILRFKEFSKMHGYSYLQSALSIFDSQVIFSKLVIGINSKQELSEIIACPISESRIDLSLISNKFSSDITDPRKWEKN